MPVKVSDDLLTVARQEARAAHRSITAQIEHWATIGRAVEVILAHRELLALKKAGDPLATVVPAVRRRETVHRALVSLVTHATDRQTAKAAIRGAGAPVYATDPDRPDLLVRVASDGTRTTGRLEGRRFVPVEKGSAKRHG